MSGCCTTTFVQRGGRPAEGDSSVNTEAIKSTAVVADVIRFWVMELVPQEVGVAHSALPHDETSTRALLAEAAAQGLHTVVVTAEEGDERAIAVLRELRAEWHTAGGKITAQLDTDAQGQL